MDLRNAVRLCHKLIKKDYNQYMSENYKSRKWAEGLQTKGLKEFVNYFSVHGDFDDDYTKLVIASLINYSLVLRDKTYL